MNRPSIYTEEEWAAMHEIDDRLQLAEQKVRQLTSALRDADAETELWYNRYSNLLTKYLKVARDDL